MREFLLKYRRIFVVAVHLVFWSISFFVSFLLRFDFQLPAIYWKSLYFWLFELLILRTAVHFYVGMFHGLWRYTGTRDLFTLVRAIVASTVLFMTLVTLAGPQGLPRSIYFIDTLLSIALVGGFRVGIRVLREIAVRSTTSGQRKRILIVGAGDAGEMLAREIHNKLSAHYEPIGFVDDNVHKFHERIHGIRVLGKISQVPELVQQHQITEVIVAIPSASGTQIRKIVEICSQSTAKIRTIPSVHEIMDGRIAVSQIRSIAIEDLLRREPVHLETKEISNFLQGQCILVTGAGGSIGSELCRQICTFVPNKLLLIERAENNLYQIHRQLLSLFPHITITPYLADINDTARVASIFDHEQPKIVFHAAAHKHVPMMEMNPNEAIKNNVLGTKSIADISQKYDVEKFIMISTDKAVNPTSIMGASKRIAEMYVQALSNQSTMQCITVRFGNVLGSVGSVVPLFQEQIQRGGPVTITHPNMVRYFMTIPEASQLVLQAATMGSGGEIFVLDMGEPVRIVDLACDLIKLSGLRPNEDIEISFTGMRPGEKLFEEIALDSETASKTSHPKIYIGQSVHHSWVDLCQQLEHLFYIAEQNDTATVRSTIATLVPEFKNKKNSSNPTHWPYESHKQNANQTTKTNLPISKLN